VIREFLDFGNLGDRLDPSRFFHVVVQAVSPESKRGDPLRDVFLLLEAVVFFFFFAVFFFAATASCCK
jgi:hypothetical protein